MANLLSIVISKLRLLRNPVKYYRSLGVKIGKDCEIYTTVNFGSEPYLITLGDHVRVNENVQFVTHDGGVWVLRHMEEALSDVDKFGPIRVGNNVHIGNNTIIMPGVTIGSNCIIGCGAVVTKDIPDNSVAVGVPAKVIESIDTYLQKNQEKLVHTKTMSKDEKKRYLMQKYCNNGTEGICDE